MQPYAERLALELQMSHEVEERQQYLGGDLTPTEKDYTEDDYSQPIQIDDDATEQDPTPTMSEIDSPIVADNCLMEASQPVIINSDDKESWGTSGKNISLCYALYRNKLYYSTLGRFRILLDALGAS